MTKIRPLTDEQYAKTQGRRNLADLPFTDESEFSTDGFSFILQRTADGKAKAIVTPVGSPPSFFLRVKVK